MTVYFALRCALMRRSATFPTSFGNAPLVRRSVIWTDAVRDVRDVFVTLPVILNVLPGAAVRGGELTVFSLIRDFAAAACAVASTARACAADRRSQQQADRDQKDQLASR